MIYLRQAKPEDINALDSLLRALSRELGDDYRATVDNLYQAGFGDQPVFHAQLALRNKDDAPRGIALYSPLFSTTLGVAGLYLSDLWVAPEQRGTGLAARLIGAAADDAARRWQASFVKLAVYDENLPAMAFYDRLGFTGLRSDEHYLVLRGDALDALCNQAQASDVKPEVE